MHRTKQKTRTGVWRARWGRTFCAFAAFFALTANAAAEAVAKIGETAYETLEAALAAVAEGKPLTWVSETAWPAATPVYYNGKFYKTETVNYAKKGALEVSIDAANEANANEVAKIYVRPGFEADELVLQAHQPMKTSLAIYGNGAKLSRNWEPCVELQGTDSDSSAHQLAKNVSLAIYNLHNGAGFWGRRATDYTVDLKLSGCENAHQVMFYGNADTSVKGKTDISVTNCTFDATQKGDHNVIVTIGAGTVEVSGTTFIAANINVKNVDGGDNAISVKGCTFKDTVAGNQNIRVRSYVEGSQAQLTVDNVTFEGASTQNIEIGDSKAACKGRVSYTISKTTGALNVYKQGATTAETTTLDATAEQPYTGNNAADPRTLGYATSGTAEALPAAPDMSGEVVNVTAAQAQYVLDGAYGSIDGKTINFTESIDATLVLGRASKYDGSKTVYRHGSHSSDPLAYADYIAYKNQSSWTEGGYYERTVQNVTFTANEGVTVKGFTAEGGAHIYGSETAPCYDYVRDTGVWCKDNSGFYKRAILKKITFKGLVFTAKVDFSTSEATTVYDSFTFTGCTFEIDDTTSTSGQAIHYSNENANDNVKNLVVEDCTFKDCFQGVYARNVKNVTVKDSTFDTTGHNAIAVQDDAAFDHGAVDITGNTFKNIGDRIIRFGYVGAGTTITITGNTADGNSGRLDTATDKREIVAATTLPENAADSIKASNNNWGENTVVAGVFIDDYATKLGTEACPYSREQFAAMTRADYIAAQERLNGTLYVNVGDCSYEKNGVLGNGERNDATGQTPDHSKLNAYGENGYLGEKNDGANGHAVVFVGGTITSGVAGYTSIDSIGTSLLLAVPAYTKVTFTNTVFKNVLSFDYQLYTAPWSQLGGLAFEGCTFDGIIVGAIAAQELAFTGCTFNDYKNTASANNSNPTWIRPAYGNWSKGDNEGQGTGFRSLTKIVFENNTVTSTRPVKFERIAQWEMATTVTATGNTFDVKPQEGDTSTKNVGLYFGANARFDLVIEKNEKKGDTAALYTAVYSAPNGTGYAGLPAGSTVKDTEGSEVTAEDALAWKKTDKITLKTTAEVASVTNAKGVSVNFATLAEAIAAAKDGETIKLLADTKENVTIAKKLTLDLNGKTLNGGTEKGKPALTVSNASVTVKDSSEAQTGTIKREDTAANSGSGSHYVIDIQGKYGFLKFEGGTVVNDSGAGGARGASLIRLGDDRVSAWPTLTVTGGTFTQNNFTVIKVDRGTLYLKGGTVNSAHSYAIENWNNAFIMGGTVNGTVSTWVYSTGAAFSKLEISGGTINGNVASVSYDNAADKQARIYVTGGTVTGTLGTYTYNNGLNPLEDPAKATIGITGGTFKEDPTKYVVEDSTITKNEDGTFGVAKAYLAKVGETSYYTMDEAFHAVVADGVTDRTVVLLRDYTTGKVQNSGSKSWMLDLNGYTWTYTRTDADSAAFEINYANVTLTVKNGKVVSASMLGLIPSAMSGTITYDNAGLVFEKVEATANGHSGIETNGNNTDDVVTLKDSTLNVPNGYGIYFASSGKVTIENSIITAKTMGVQVCSGSLNISGDTSKIEVTGDAVAKTENDGAIEDGAAVSVVNRPGYKGLGTIAISGGTFKAKDGNAAIKAYTWENKTESAFDNANGTVAVRGGTFSTAVEEKYCAEGFIPTKNDDNTYGVKQGAYVAAIGETKYETLAKAIAAAKSGDTITLLADVVNTDYTVANAIDIKLASGVTLDGNGKTISGNVKVTVSSEGDVTIKDADFRGIHNAAVVSDSYKTKYGFSDDKVGTLSAIYAPKLAGALTILGCAFENCDWEAMQITPAEGAKIHIRDNVFKTSESDVVKEQLRHVHVEMAYGTGFDYEGTDIELAITDNQFHGETKEANMGVWWVGKASKLDVTGNYYENPDAVSITLSDKSFKRENRCDLIYPARSKADVDVDDLTAVALVVKDAFNATAHTTVALAIEAVKDGEIVRLLDNATEDVTVGKSITLDLNGKKLTNTGSSKATVSIAEGATVTVKNGSIVGGAAYYNIEVKKGGTATFESITATAGNTGSSMIDNWGTLTIDSGSYTGGLNVVKSEEDSVLKITGGTFTLTDTKGSAYTAVILTYGDTTISGGEFIQSVKEPKKWAHPIVVMTGLVDGHPAVTKVTGGTFKNNATESIFRGLGKATSANFEVSGGTFNKSIKDGYCAEGFIPTKNADGTYGVKKGTYVAAVVKSSGTVTGKYETLADALAKASTGTTVKLLAEAKENVTIAKDITFDLNGKTLNGGTEKGKPALTVTAKVTVKDSSEAQTGTIKREDTVANSGSGSHYVIDIQDDGWLTFESGSVTNGSGAGGTKGASLVRVGNDGKAKDPGLTVKGGTFTQDNFIAIKVDRGTLLMEGGTVNSTNSYAIENWWSATLSGGAVNGAVSSWTYSGGTDSTLKITGGTINGDVTAVNYGDAEGKTATVEIGGGTVNGKLDTRRYDPATGALTSIKDPAKATIAARGGTFSTAVDEAYCAAGFIPTKKNADGTYGVESIVVSIEVSVGDSKKVALPFLKTWLRVNIGETETQWTAANLEEQAANGWAKWVDGVLGLSTTAAQAGAAVAAQGTDAAIPVSLAHADAKQALLKTDALKIAYVLSGSNDRTSWTKVAEEADKVKLAIPLDNGTLYKYYRVDVEIVAAE